MPILSLERYQHASAKESVVINDEYPGPQVHTAIPGPLTKVS